LIACAKINPVSTLLKRTLIGIVTLVVLVAAGTIIYTKFINQADDEFSQDDVNERLDATTTTGEGGAGGSIAPSGDGVDGIWTIGGDSEVGYRVDETINGVGTTANGRTKAITGSLSLTGTIAEEADFTVDMTTFTSSDSRRDGQFDGRIMEVDEFPTAQFVLTEPIDFQQIPTDSGSVTVNATGDLTLHGVTKSVTFELTATFKNGRIGILGQIPVVFADYDLENPSFATVTTEDNGLLEFVLVLDRT